MASPKEILFSPTADCNLSCPHCANEKSEKVLSKNIAIKFLRGCKRIDIDRVGCTGGEPFLALNFLCGIVAAAVREGFLFDKIMTNAVWYKDRVSLKAILEKLFRAGYDGSISISVDAYHAQSLKKLAYFIDSVVSIWRRPDMVGIVYVTGRDTQTKKKLSKLARLLNARLVGFGGRHPCIRSIDSRFRGNDKGFHGSRAGLNLPYHIKIAKIDISPIGKASKLKDPWNGRWFEEDYCKGPGDVFFVTPSGDVKPCCGYANDLDMFTIGNIRRDSPEKILKNFSKNRHLYAIFNSGLSMMRERLEKLGIVFPGKTSSHCYFCRYILTEVPKCVLEKCLS